MSQNRPNPAPIEDRKTRVYELAVNGMSLRKIGRELGISFQRAHQLMHEALAEIPPAERDAQRRLATDRLDDLLVKVQDEIDAGGDLAKLAPVVLQIESRRARLLGLDAPTQVQATVHEVDKVDVELAEIVREAKAQAAAQEQEIRSNRG